MQGMSPYWMDRTMATRNDVDLEGMCFLTAPNMSGKSTLMRSLLVVYHMISAVCSKPIIISTIIYVCIYCCFFHSYLSIFCSITRYLQRLI